MLEFMFGEFRILRIESDVPCDGYQAHWRRTFWERVLLWGGIQSVPIGRSPFGTPIEVLELGYTHIPKEIFEEFLQEIGYRYTMATYSLLNNNCNHFTDEAAQFLVGCGIPQRILNQANEALNNPLGAMMVPMLQQLETTLRYGGVPAAPINNPANPSPWPNPLAPTRSRSTVSMSRGSSAPFPCPPVSTSAAVIPPAAHTEPARARGSEQRRGDKERGTELDADREK